MVHVVSVTCDKRFNFIAVCLCTDMTLCAVATCLSVCLSTSKGFVK